MANFKQKKNIVPVVAISTIFAVFMVLSLACASTPKAVSTEICDNYPMQPVEEIIQSERTVQELMSDVRQYFKKSYVDCSTNATQTDATLISMRFYPTVNKMASGSIINTCDFNVNVEFKDDGRIRFSTENIYVGQASSRGKEIYGGHDWMYPQVGVDTDKIRTEAGKKYNEIVKEMQETLHRIAAGKTEYTW